MSTDYKGQFLGYGYTYFLRGICMIAIVFAHTANEFNDILASLHITSVWLCGRYATGVFLFLSGYGITLSLRRNNIDARYVARHFRNLLLPYILFWVFYMVTGVLSGYLPTEENILADILMMKMPNTDTWFFRTILGLYLLYFAIWKLTARHSGLYISIIIIIYVTILAIRGTDSYWWNTILCFPTGILFASKPILRRRIPFFILMLLVCLVFVFQKYMPIVFISEIGTPIFCCLVCAYLSTIVSPLPNVPVVSFIGKNSLYMYLMETIPVDYLQSQQVGFIIFVFGGIIITVILTYMGKSFEKLLHTQL